jgi:hypothetical protein
MSPSWTGCLSAAVARRGLLFVYRILGDALTLKTRSNFQNPFFFIEILRCVTSLPTLWSPGLEAGTVSLLADPPPKCNWLIIRKYLFLLMSSVSGVCTCYSVLRYSLQFGIFYIVRLGSALRILAVTSHSVRLADQVERVNDPF